MRLPSGGTDLGARSLQAGQHLAVASPLRRPSSPVGVAVWEGYRRGMVWLVVGGAPAKSDDTPCVPKRPKPVPLTPIQSKE
jgi:hypothetical protein